VQIFSVCELILKQMSINADLWVVCLSDLLFKDFGHLWVITKAF
jgi:hypothetical protein